MAQTAPTVVEPLLPLVVTEKAFDHLMTRPVVADDVACMKDNEGARSVRVGRASLDLRRARFEHAVRPLQPGAAPQLRHDFLPGQPAQGPGDSGDLDNRRGDGLDGRPSRSGPDGGNVMSGAGPVSPAEAHRPYLVGVTVTVMVEAVDPAARDGRAAGDPRFASDPRERGLQLIQNAVIPTACSPRLQASGFAAARSTSSVPGSRSSGCA